MPITWYDRCSVLIDLYLIVKAATLPTVKTVFSTPRLLLQPTDLRSVFFENVWKFMGDGVNEAGRETKTDLLSRANGTVFEIGAGALIPSRRKPAVIDDLNLGHGHSCQYLDLTKVTKYIALEPNLLMHDTIIMNATKAGFSPDQIQVIGHGAEETAEILKALGGEQVDTIISILSLCGVPDAEGSISRMIRDILKPRGLFLFYEHVRCDPSPTLMWWQTFWTPLWQPIIGCRLDKPTHIYIEKLDLWEKREVWGKLPSEEPNLFWHRTGFYVKKGI